MTEFTAAGQRAMLARLTVLTPEQSSELAAVLDSHGHDYGVYPLSASQQPVWLHAQLRPASPAFNIPFAFLVTGPLDPAALQLALADLVARHEALRTVIVVIGDEPRQAVMPEVEFRLEVTDAEPGWLDGPRAAAECAAEAARPFDLGGGLLLRARLITSGPSAALLLLTLHHIACDGWSIQILFSELSACYAARAGGSPALLPAPELQYPDYARWQRSWLAGSERSRLTGYWKSQLAGLPPLLELPADRPRPAVVEYSGAAEAFTWDSGLSGTLGTFCRQEGVTPFAAVFAGFAAVLSRYTAREDIPVATVLANRGQPGLERVVGFFANPVVLRCHVPPGEDFRALVRSVSTLVAEAHEYQELPFGTLVEALNPVRDASYSPLAQVMLAFQDGPPPVLALIGATVEPISTHSGSSQFDLSLSVWQAPAARGSVLAGVVEYRTALFGAPAIRRLLGHVRTLLGAALAAPSGEIASLPLLTEAETRELRSWTGAGAVSHAVADAVEFPERWAARTPDAPALADPRTEWGYGEMDARANRLAHHLRALGVEPGAVVGVHLRRQVELPLAFLAVLKASAVYLPLDPAYPPGRLGYMAADAGVTAVITQPGLPLPPLEPGVLVLSLDDEAEAIASRPAVRPERDLSPEAAAYVIYTSGSTGQPKGTVLTHRGLCNVAEANREFYGLGQETRVLQFASASFDASVSEFVFAFVAGAQLRLVPREELLPGPDLARTVRRHGITAVMLPPSALSVMDPADLAGLRTLIVAGEACPQEAAAIWAPGRDFFNVYGPTEATIWATAARCDGTEAKPPIGRPIRGVEAHVLDTAQGQLPVGIPGELCLGGEALARGYARHPALTAERFLPDPYSGRPGARLYLTGDIVRRLPDGQLDYLGRSDSQAKIRGYRIELGEIEAQLAALAGVDHSAVTVREDTLGDRRIVAYVQSSLAGPVVDPAGVRRELAAMLPDFMVPSAVVVLDRIPLTVNGKVDYRQLPPPTRSVSPGRSAPLSGLEREIAQCWQELLGTPDIGTEENFFDLGGNSLLLAKARARLSTQLGQDIPAQLLFRHPTVHDLARALRDGGGRPVPEAGTPDGRAAGGRRMLIARARRAGEGQ
jgi:amino acid adenylation domain-containing protein